MTGCGVFAGTTIMNQPATSKLDRLVLLIFVLGARKMLARTFQWRSLLALGIIAGVGVPLGLFLIGHFPIYYYWMGFGPVALGVFATLGEPGEATGGRCFRLAAYLIVAVATLAGLPRRLAVAATEWQARSYAPVMALVEPLRAANANHEPVLTKVRTDHAVIAAMVVNGAKVLDVGCADGALLHLLARERGVKGRGMELSQAGVNACVSKGLSVVQGDAADVYSPAPSPLFAAARTLHLRSPLPDGTPPSVSSRVASACCPE